VVAAAAEKFGLKCRADALAKSDDILSDTKLKRNGTERERNGTRNQSFPSVSLRLI
jgi:hypothetical protein